MAEKPSVEVRLAALEVIVRGLLLDSPKIAGDLKRLKALVAYLSADASARAKAVENLVLFPGQELTERPEVRMEVLHILDEWIAHFEADHDKS